MQNEPSAKSPIEDIPDPQTLRERLAQNQRERDLLKGLLRLSLRVAKQDRQRKERVREATS